MATEIKSCPCGSDNIKGFKGGGIDGVVGCGDCGFQAPNLKAWNTRAVDVVRIEAVLNKFHSNVDKDWRVTDLAKAIADELGGEVKL